MLSFSQPTIVLFFFTLTILALIKYQQYPERIFGLLFIALYSCDLVSENQVISSFANQGLLTLILLIICSLALEKTRLLKVVTNYVIKKSYNATWLRLFGLTTIASAILNNTAVVSTMLAPIRNNTHHAASKLLLPLSYAAILGGTLTLVGTSTNLIVNSMVIEAGMPSLRFFDFTLVGLSVVSSCGILLFLSSRLLPSKQLKQQYASDYLIDTEVMLGSTLIGHSIENNGLRNLESLFLVEILRSNRLISPVAPSEVIQANDRLIFSGDIKKVTHLSQFSGLSSFANQNGLPMNNLTEVIIRPESVLIGCSLKKVGFRALFDAAVVAIKRDGETVSGKLGELSLKAGDYLVLAVGDDFKARHNIQKNFFVISGVETEQLLDGYKEKLAIGGFFVAILLAACNLLPLFKGMLILLAGLLMTGCLNGNEVLQRLPKNIWLIIASALLLAQALSNSGAFTFFDDFVRHHQDAFTPFIGLVLVYLMTWLLTELVTNNAAAALIFPIGYELAASLSISPMPYVMAVAFAASASFISPYSYQTNLMVYNAGQYRLTDFIKVGLPISLLYGVTVITALSLIYDIGIA
ncbi:SLC13 family permease [Photobacterium leiognathi]|uniref:SLC13 family permease n=1 Tax=Photobacterium leiognathi TaxID=553611 RepID=UPI00076AB0A1|nr:SLC13 family permease [Photobacterium leiognathi]